MVILTEPSAEFWERLEAQHTLALWRLPETPPAPRVPEARFRPSASAAGDGVAAVGVRA